MLPTNAIEQILEVSASPYKNYCTGYPGTGGYIVTTVMGISAVADPCGHSGLNVLDSIKAFDLAESSEAYIGQINMTTVSSFCGPEGLIWGHDVARTKAPSPHLLAGAEGMEEFRELRIHAGHDLRLAARSLFGTAGNRRFPILHGSHVPCASRYQTVHGPARLFAAFAVGFPAGRDTAACLLLEDAGMLEFDMDAKEVANARGHILKDIIRAARAIGRNHGATYNDLYIDFTERRIEEGEVGCALVAMPYIQLAQGAYNMRMASQTLEEWEKNIGRIDV
jgi:histidine decarboxylase